MMTPRLQQLIEQLDPNQVQEIEDFAAFLATRRERITSDPDSDRRLTLDWVGALSHLRDRYADGLELQQVAMRWRIDGEMRDVG